MCGRVSGETLDGWREDERQRCMTMVERVRCVRVSEREAARARARRVTRIDGERREKMREGSAKESEVAWR